MRNSMSVTPRLTRAVPVIFVADVQTSAKFFRDTLGFSIDFLHGNPPFYGAVSRDDACIHIKFVHHPVLALGAEDDADFINAFVEVDNVDALYTEYVEAGATFAASNFTDPRIFQLIETRLNAGAKERAKA